MYASEPSPVVIYRAEVINRWETQHEAVSTALEEKLPELLKQLGVKFETMPIPAFPRRGRYYTDQLEPIVRSSLEAQYAVLSEELDEAFQSSVANVEAESDANSVAGWSYSEMAAAGGAAVAIVAPLAALPFLARGLVTSGTVVLGLALSLPALIPSAATAAATGLPVAAAGPTVRNKARRRLKSGFKKVAFEKARARVVGNPAKPELGSLKGLLLSD